MLLVEILWAQRVWALPCLSVLAPSQRYHQAQGVRHKTLSDWARQMLKQVRRWVPERQIVAVGNRCFAVLDLLATSPDRSARAEAEDQKAPGKSASPSVQILSPACIN